MSAKVIGSADGRANTDIAAKAAALAAWLVEVSVRRPGLVILISCLLGAAGLTITATRFAITTQTDQLLEGSSAWRRDRTAFRAAFPQLDQPILLVVQGKTPELAEAAARRMDEALAKEVSGKPGELFERVWRPDGGAFFDREGLLLLQADQLKTYLAKIVEQGPLLSAISGDPTLRGLARLVQLGAFQDELKGRAGFLDKLSDPIEAILAGKPAWFSWSSLMSDGAAAADDDSQRLMRFVLVDARLDFKSIQPAAEATSRIRKIAADLNLTPETGVTVRLTGAAPLADEEFSTVEEGAPLHLGLSVVAICVILYAALRSGKLIGAVLFTTLIGLLITLGAGLLMVGRFNVISIAVSALFLGLGVDFGIQFAVRYRDERFKRNDPKAALLAAADGVGWSLALAGASLVVGFFAFLPTSFKGVSELGLITGVGMVFAFTASLTLLPALIEKSNPPGEPDSVETPWLAGVDHWILRNRMLVIGASALVLLGGIPFLLKLQFDANPMHLRSAKTEAVATFLDLTKTPGMTTNVLHVLAPSLEAARALTPKLDALPTVSRVTSLATFVPADQEAKRAAIAEAAAKLPAIMRPQPPAEAPTDAQIVTALRNAAGALKDWGGSASGEDAQAAKRLSGAFEQLAAAPVEKRKAAAETLTGTLPPLLAQLRGLLSPEPITQASLPESLRDEWLSKTGQVRIDVMPKGDANDNDVIDRFVENVGTVAPNMAGAPVDIVASRQIITQSFAIAGALAFAGIFIILSVALKNPLDVVRTLGPLVVAMIMTLEAAQLIGMSLNLANIIALPLMLAVGVNFHIYYLIAWRQGVLEPLASSLTRAIFFSSLTTGVAFGSLWLSNHPGTASMGKLLTLSLVFTLLAAFIMVPAVLGAPKEAARGPLRADRR